MYEYGITNKKTNENEIIFGRTLADAYRRAKLNPEEWTMWYREYID